MFFATQQVSQYLLAAISVSLLAIANSASINAQSSKLDWKEYVSPQGKFSILFPGKPETGYRPIGADSESSVTYVTNVIIDEKAWAVAYFDLPAAPPDEKAIQARFDRTRDHMLKMYSVKATDEEKVLINGYPVRAFKTKTDDQRRVQHTKIYLVGQRVYQVWALVRVGDEETSGLAGYFNSFKPQPLTAQESQAALAKSQADANAAPPRKIKVSSGVLLENAVKKVQAKTPPLINAKGTIGVMVTVSYEGEVIRAEAISGPPALRDAAVETAKQWKFKPMKLGDLPVMMEGVLLLEFK